MNIFSSKQPVDMDQLERDVTQTLRGAPGQESGQVNDPIPYAKPRPAERYAPLQVIGHAITRLTWKEAEAMGKAIAERMKDVKDMHDLTSAIQSWAAEWESFTDVQA